MAATPKKRRAEEEPNSDGLFAAAATRSERAAADEKKRRPPARTGSLCWRDDVLLRRGEMLIVEKGDEAVDLGMLVTGKERVGARD